MAPLWVPSMSQRVPSTVPATTRSNIALASGRGVRIQALSSGRCSQSRMAPPITATIDMNSAGFTPCQSLSE